MSDAEHAESIEDLLYEGETPVEELHLEDTRIVVTGQRLLVVRDRGAPRVRAVDRPNLGEVRRRTLSTRGHLLSAVQWAGLGVFLLVAWQVVPFGELVRPVESPPGVGFEGLFAAANALITLFAFLDEAFLLAGALALAWGIVRVGRYLHGRERILEVTVAGADSIRLPATASPETVDRLQTLVQSATAADTD